MKSVRGWGRLGMKFNEYRFDEITLNYDKNRIPLSALQREKHQGKYRYFGAQGIIDYVDDYIFDGKYLLIAEDGENLKSKKQNIAQIVEGQFWVNNHAHIVKCNEHCILEYLAYLINKKDISGYITGSAQPKLSQANLNAMIFNIPEVAYQEKILSVLLPIENKIQINTEINDNLLEQAMILFKSWFIDYEPFDKQVPTTWKSGVLGDFVEIKRGGSPRPIQNFLSDSGLHWLKISDATNISSPFINEIKEYIIEDGLKKTVFLKAGSLVLSNSATPGLPKILDIDACIHDGWLYFPSSKFSNEYLYLYFKHIRDNLVALGNGSVFTNLKTDILKNYPTHLPPDKILNEFDGIVKPIFSMILSNTRESKRLTEIRDTLLPHLMSSELDISDIEL